MRRLILKTINHFYFLDFSTLLPVLLLRKPLKNIKYEMNENMNIK